MLNPLLIDPDWKSPIKVLCLGAHCDDIEIGCGGTILKLLEERSEFIFSWVTFSSHGQRSAEAKESAGRFLKNSKSYSLIVKEFRDGFFPYSGIEIKEFFEELKEEFDPDLIFTHCRSDFHQDHRLISDLTWNTFRNHLILEYEIPKYDGDFASPNLFVQLSEQICREKIEILHDAYCSQKNKQWFTKDTFWSLMRIRGMEANSATKYAEGFYCRKIVF
jgi:LmbE family N-acetylglucosaminyl deacetylase